MRYVPPITIEVVEQVIRDSNLRIEIAGSFGERSNKTIAAIIDFSDYPISRTYFEVASARDAGPRVPRYKGVDLAEAIDAYNKEP